MAKHAHVSQKWAYSAEQMAAALQNPAHSRYKQGMLDALRAVARLESGRIKPATLQTLLDGLPNTWDQSLESAYVTGFEDMYGIMAETMALRYAPELERAAKLSKNVEGEPAAENPGPAAYPDVPEGFVVVQKPDQHP